MGQEAQKGQGKAWASFYPGFHRKGKSRQGEQAEDWFLWVISADLRSKYSYVGCPVPEGREITRLLEFKIKQRVWLEHGAAVFYSQEPRVGVLSPDQPEQPRI